MVNDKIGLSGSSLKIFAIAIMLIDHIGGILLPQYILLRIIGRLAFPIFCFLLVEGFLHTHNVQKYALRLGFFALISELPFDLAIYQTPFFWGHQNIFFTLFIGLIVLIGLDRFKDSMLPKLIIFLGGSLLAQFCCTDYGAFGIVMIVLFYLYYIHNNFIILTLSIIFLSVLAGGIQIYGALAIIPIALYNGKRGISLKYFFYIFYPLHLFILYLIASCLYP